MLDAEVRNTTPPKDMEKNPRRKVLVVASGNNVENTNGSNKKIIRRDMERRRRQEMGNLSASLRSMLPLEYVKGKRSISDHMHEAVNYINHLQMRIQDLGAKRDELRNQSYNMSSCDSVSGFSRKRSRHCVIVSPCLEGLEILISGGFKEEGMMLSEVMEVLLEEGLGVQSCFSTQVRGGFLHTINCKVSDPTGFDLSVLQQRLWNAVTPSS